jgi:hypothetical protein
MDQTPPAKCLDAIKPLAPSPRELLAMLDIESPSLALGTDDEEENAARSSFSGARTLTQRVKFFVWLARQILA